MNVSLTPELESFVKELVESGNYTTVSEVVGDGLRMLAKQLELKGLVSEFHDKIAEAEADVAAGRMIDGDGVREMLREHREVLAAEIGSGKS